MKQKLIITITCLLFTFNVKAQKDTAIYVSGCWSSWDGIVSGVSVVTKLSPNYPLKDKVGDIKLYEGIDSAEAIRRGVQTARKYQEESEMYRDALMEAISFITDFDSHYLTHMNAVFAKIMGHPNTAEGIKVDKMRQADFNKYKAAVNKAYPSIYK